MAERIVTREEFLAHLEALITGKTDEPCTLETTFPVYDRTADMQQVGHGSMSYFVEHTDTQFIIEQYNKGDKGVWLPVPLPGETLNHYRERVRSRHVERNWTAIGMRSPAVRLDTEIHDVEVEEQAAKEQGEQVRYVIGKKSDRRGIGKQGDPPGVDFGA